jgi:hypothetical protein
VSILIITPYRTVPNPKIGAAGAPERLT